MNRTIRNAILLTLACLAIAVGAVARAADVVNQGAGSAAVTPWKVYMVAPGSSTAVGGSPFVTAGAPAFILTVTSVSTPTPALTTGASYRVACNTQVFFRTGAATPVALTTDAPIFGPAVEYLALKTGSTMFAFITASGTATCTGTLITATP